MNTNLSKFDLIASMMKRLDVSPSALTMNWLQEQVLSFACLARSSHQDEPEQRLVGTFVSLELLPAAAGHAVSLPREEEVASSSAEVQVPQIFGSQNKEAEQKLSADDPSGKMFSMTETGASRAESLSSMPRQSFRSDAVCLPMCRGRKLLSAQTPCLKNNCGDKILFLRECFLTGRKTSCWP